MTMDAGTKRRLTWGLVSNLVSKLSNSIIQFVQVPVFLAHWSKPLYGDWMLVNNIPTFLAMSNIGFGSVAGNEMTMAEARGDREGALRSFQTCWWLIVAVMIAVFSVVALVLALVPVGTLLNVHVMSEMDTRWIIAYLGVSVLVGQLETLLQAAYRSVGRYSYGSFVKSMMTLGAFAAVIVPVALGQPPRVAALVYAAANITGTLTLMLLVRRDIPWISYGWQYATRAELKRMVLPAFAFMGFPLGNALNLQGTLQAVGYVLGENAVVDFGLARQVSRVALQMVQMINSTFEPEFSKSFAQNNTGLVRSLHRRACQMALLLALGIVAAMMIGGPAFLSHWTGGKVPPSRGLLSILLLVVVVYALWSTSSTILTATNQHKRLAGVYVGATGITVIVTFFAAKYYGLYGAAASLLLSEFLMNLYVLPNTLRIAHDTFPAFLRSMLDVPPALHPRTLLRRLGRQQPE
jgi:O-antigen/teichoic acid export membrane protein